MARKNDYGKFIIAAGEVASYVVCPEAWKLAHISNYTKKSSRSTELGNHLHRDWDKQIQQVRYFARSLKVGLALLILASLFLVAKYFLVKNGQVQ